MDLPHEREARVSMNCTPAESSFLRTPWPTRDRAVKNRVRSLYVVYEAGDRRTNIYGSRTDVLIM